MTEIGSDITYDIGDVRFLVRVAGVIRSEGKVLLSTVEDEALWFLPGGRVKAGETFEEAITREMNEELACRFEIERFVAIVENFFQHQGQKFQEICAYFELSLGDPPDRVSECFEGERRVWLTPQEALAMPLVPPAAKTLIENPQPDLQLLVSRDG